MKYNPDIHHRRSIRLKGYDYSRSGAYFITICTHDRQCLFGEVVDGRMRLNALGEMARQCWQDIPRHFPHAALDAFVVMPNHVHGIVWIVNDPNQSTNDNDVGAKTVGAKSDEIGSLGDASETVGAKNFSPLRSSTHSHQQRANHDSPGHSTPSSPPAPQNPRPRGTSKTIGSIVRGFKIGVTKWARQHTDIHIVWQRNYYEHIVRDENDLNRIREYIMNNPLNWAKDQENPSATRKERKKR